MSRLFLRLVNAILMLVRKYSCQAILPQNWIWQFCWLIGTALFIMISCGWQWSGLGLGLVASIMLQQQFKQCCCAVPPWRAALSTAGNRLRIRAKALLKNRAGRSRAWFLVGLFSFTSLSVFETGLLSPAPAQAATITFAPGAYIIDLGQATQTIGNGLKPYGMVFDLVINKAIPVQWAINPGKTKDGIDFTANSKSYKGSAFIIAPEFASAAAATVATWKAQGVVVDGPLTTSFSAPIYDTITSFPNSVLDLQKGAIALPYFTNAGIPASSSGTYGSFNTYRQDYPSGLTDCDDIFIMPHADPTWLTHKNLIPFNQTKGFIWAGCHAVSVLENLDDPGDADTLPNMNFLSTNTALVPFGSHAGGSPPYSYTPSTAVDPIMQFIGLLDGAQEGGSEQIYMPRIGSAWRSSTSVAVYDPTQANVPSISPGLAAKLAYGPGFGNSNNGIVMYEGGHSVNGSSPPYIAAQRAFLNFILYAGLVRGLRVSINIPNPIGTGQTVNVSASVTGGTGSYRYQWYSDCGGTFGNSTAGSTTFKAPSTGGTCNVRAVVWDGCNRRSFGFKSVVVQAPTADLSITKTDGQASVMAGSAITYTMTVSNSGPDTLSSLTLSDPVPAAILSPAFTPSTGVYNNSTGVWSGLNLASGQSITLTLKGTVNATATGNLVNTATVAVPSGFTDPTPGNNSSTDTDTILPPQADLSITKTDNQGSTTQNNEIVYTITVTNNGPSTVSSVTLTDTTSSGSPAVASNGVIGSEIFIPSVGTLSPSNATFGGSGNPAGVATMIWNGLNLAAGQSAILSFTGKVGINDTKSPLTNTITVAPPSGVTDPNSANNSSTDVDTVIVKTLSADLQLAKAASPSTVIPGNQVTYTLTVTNKGSDTINSFFLTENLPATILSPTFTPSSGSYNPTTGNWTGITFAKNQILTLTITGTVDPTLSGSQTINNTATVSTPAGVNDGSSGNNDASASITTATPSADLTITKDDGQTVVAPGNPITYTLTVKNNGPSTVSGVTVTDSVPATILSPSFTPSVGSYNSGTGAWTGLSLAAGQTATLTLSGTVSSAASGTLTNTATVAAPTGVTDPTPGNNSSTDSDTITPFADLSIVKDDNQVVATAGSPITYTMTVINNGPTTVNSVTVTDSVPAAILSPSFTPSSGSYNSGTGAWTGLTLAAGQSATLTLNGTVNLTATGSLTNTATVAPPAGMTDPNSSNNSSTDTDTIKAPAVDLSISKTDGQNYAAPGSAIAYTITVTNNGPSTVNSVTVTDAIAPANGITGVTFTPSTGSYNSSTGAWTGLSLAPGQSIRLTLAGTVNPSITGNLSNTATVSPPTGYTDPNSANNSSTDTDATSTVTTRTADLSISKTDNQAIASPGTPITYAITLTNNGPDTVNSVTINDAVPAAILNPVFATADGSFDGSTGEWTGLNLTAGSSVTLILDGDVSVSATGTLTNTATVIPPIGFADPNSANNSSTDTDTIAGPLAPAQVVLVKRITAINGTPITTYAKSPTDNYDTDPKWPTPVDGNGVSTYLQGAIDGGKVKPGDELEYTIYFLSSSTTPATNISICDLVPTNSTFVPSAYSSSPQSGIDLAIGSSVTHLTNVPDGDAGQFFQPNVPPSVTCSAANTNGAVVVRVVQSPTTLPATAGSPAYGFIRFRAKVN